VGGDCGSDSDGILLVAVLLLVRMDVDKEDDDSSFGDSSPWFRYEGSCDVRRDGSASSSNVENSGGGSSCGGNEEEDNDGGCGCSDDREFTLDSNAMSDMSSMLNEYGPSVFPCGIRGK
jgi:hypothetical protein